jgi:5-methylcytosine-specific restriction endonuclease McrA
MSRRRHVDLPFEQARDQGQHVCVWCGVSLTGTRRQRWCGQKCVLTYQIAKGDQGAARKWLRRDWESGPRGYTLREHLPCAICGLDMSETAIEARLADEPPSAKRRALLRDQHRWEADHIVPLVEGGAAHPSNLRVLCRVCHLDETRALRARQAAARAKAKESA